MPKVYEEKRIRLIKEIQDADNFKFDVTKVHYKTGFSKKMIKSFYENAIEKKRLLFMVDYLDDNQMAELLKDEEEGDEENV